jgi:hypothetical protein
VNVSYVPKVSRRTALQWIGAFAGYATTPARLAVAQGGRVSALPLIGYGTDPDLLDSVVPWPRTMSARELLLTADLSDLILPPTATAPAPSVIGAPDYLDEWVSAPYPEQQADRPLLLSGLAWLDDEAQRRYQHGFVENSEAERIAILDDIVAGRAGAANQQDFFFRMRFLVMGVYYTTREGFADIGYVGNTPLQAYPAPTRAEVAILERELQKLGL